MNRKIFFVLAAFTAFVALIGPVATAADDDDTERCNVELGDYKIKVSSTKSQIVTLDTNKECTLANGTESVYSYLEYAQYYKPSCTGNVIRFTNISFGIGATNGLSNSSVISDCSVILRKAEKEGDSYKPGVALYSKEFPGYEFETEKSDYSFLIDYCTNRYYLYIFITLIILYRFI